MITRSCFWVLVCATAPLVSCTPSAHLSDRASRASLPHGATPAWAISRYAKGKRAIYARPELEILADHFVKQLPRRFKGRTPRLVIGYFVSMEGERFLGEWIRHSLASLLVEKGRGVLEVYTRRKLTRVMEEHKLQTKGYGGGYFDESTIVEAGKLSGVDAVISATLDVRRGREIVVNCQVIEVTTGRILPSKVVRIPLRKKVTPRRPVWDEQAATEILAKRIFDDLPEGKNTMAAYPISRGRREFTTGSNFLQYVVTAASNLDSDRLEQVTRARLNSALKEHKFYGSMMFDDDAQEKVLNFVGANLVMTGQAEKFSGLYAYNIQVIDVETAQILVAQTALVNDASADDFGGD